MSKISKSPERFTFQKERYLERRAEEGRTPENDPNVKAMLEYYDTWAVRAADDEVNPNWQKNNLEYDLRTCEWILEKVRDGERYAQNLYAALCNNEFQKRDLWPMLKEETWSCTWRYAGGIIADMRQQGDYIDWYCSGIRGDSYSDEDFQTLTDEQKNQYLEYQQFVSEGTVTEEIRDDLFKLGWLVVDDGWLEIK